jgi:hypothetical protein
LKYTDPSGFFLSKLVKKVHRFFRKYGKTILAIGLSAIAGYGVLQVLAGPQCFATFGAMVKAAGIAGAVASGAVGGFVSGAIMAGTLKGAVRGAIYGGLSAGIAGGIGLGGFNPVIADALHGVAQGTLSEAFGGDFKSGFIGAFVGHSVGAKLKQLMPDTIVGRTIAAAVAGGAASALGGGKFANGAVSAAFSHLFNTETDAGSDSGKKTEAEFLQGAQDGHLTLGEANAWYRSGKGDLMVDASKLIVVITGPANSNGLVPARVIGEDWIVHGSVMLDSSPYGYHVRSGMYDFEWHDISRYANPWDGVVRNLKTFAGNVVAGFGTPYRIHYSGTVNVQ